MLSVGGLVRCRVLQPRARELLGRWATPSLTCTTESRVRTASGVGGANGAGGWYGSLSDSAPVHLCENFLVSVHQVSGLPWWLSIAMATMSVRTFITLPLAAYQLIIIAKFQKNLRHLVSQLYIRDNCHPFKASLLVWVQLPLWVSLSLALRNLSLDHSGVCPAESQSIKFPATGSERVQRVLSFNDPHRRFCPICELMSPLYAARSELGWVTQLMASFLRSGSEPDADCDHILVSGPLSKFYRSEWTPGAMYLRWNSCLTCCSSSFYFEKFKLSNILFLSSQSMALYWFCSSLVGFSHNLLLRSPTVHRTFRLPAQRSETPYRDLLLSFINKYWK
ncbi:hypothetical protein XENOCAPTIV_015061 [Xenoophorus captivus]|uniref:Mitochondrial inner membrane protein COX18 n=1 Tax=Xenoophorus captivus TaxID=1517983 RepID=A0ABV0S7E0_9TELE